MHVHGMRTLRNSQQMVQKTHPVDDTEPNKKGTMEAWQNKLFHHTSLNKNWARKKPTMNHAFEKFYAQRGNIRVKRYRGWCANFLWVVLQTTVGDCRNLVGGG